MEKVKYDIPVDMMGKRKNDSRDQGYQNTKDKVVKITMLTGMTGMSLGAQCLGNLCLIETPEATCNLMLPKIKECMLGKRFTFYTLSPTALGIYPHSSGDTIYGLANGVDVSSVEPGDGVECADAIAYNYISLTPVEVDNVKYWLVTDAANVTWGPQGMPLTGWPPPGWDPNTQTVKILVPKGGELEM